MLRNYTETAGGRIVSGTRFVGPTGAELLATGLLGDFGPSIWHNKGLDPTKRYRAIVTSSSGASFTLNEDGSGEAQGAFTASLRLLEDNVEFAADVALGTSTAGLGMLRNYSELAGGKVISGTRFVGLTGAEILAATSTGDFGPGIFANQDVDPALRYRALVLTSSGASFTLNEDGSGQSSGPFSATLQLLEENIAYSSAGELGVVRLATGELSAVEAEDDRARFVLTVSKPIGAVLAWREPIDDLARVRANVAAAVTATVAFREVGDDTARFVGTAGEPQFAVLAFQEDSDDGAFIRLVVAGTSVVGGMLAALAAEFEAQRAPHGLYIDTENVLLCAMKATRFYAGWAELQDPTSRAGVFSISGATTVTPDEWAIIKPLFILYVERESALAIEASRVMGVELVGRDSATVSADITQVESELPLKAYVEPIQTFGMPEGF